jgi:hypothetical protein
LRGGEATYTERQLRNGLSNGDRPPCPSDNEKLIFQEPLAKLHPRSLTNIRSVPQRDTELRSFASILAASVDIRRVSPASGKPVASPSMRAGAR